MKKLEDIPKKEIFNVPDGYFDSLPSAIQARVAEKGLPSPRSTFQVALKYAIAAVVIVAGTVFWFNQSKAPLDVETMLAGIQTEDLVAYLNESDISTEELLDAANFNPEDLEDIESEVYGLDLQGLELDDLDLDAAPHENDI
jgi:hypothetical protein